MTRLGLLYGIYRCVVAAILCAVYAFDILSLREYDINVNWYSLVVLVYITLTILQLLSLVVYQKPVRQIFWMGLVDVICLGAIHFTIGHLNLHVGFLFIVTVFVLNLVQPIKTSILLTLGAIISVVYLPFIDSLLKPGEGERILNSILLTLMFIVVAVIAKIAVGHYERLQELSKVKTDQFEQFKEVAYRIMLDVETGYLVINSNFQIIFINKVAQTILGDSVKVDDLIGLNQPFFEDFVKCRVGRIDADKFTCVLGGVEFFSSFQKITPSKDLYLLTFQDSRKVNERIHNLKLAALGQISASIAHEIRNPLTTISQAVGLIDGATVEQMPRYCKIINKQCVRIDEIIQSTLDMAKNRELQPIRFSVHEFISTIVNEDLMEIRSDISVVGETDLYIMFDEGHFRQVITNLIRNAVRHNNPEKSEKIEIRILNSFRHKEVLIDVVDFGDGVPPHIVEKLFIPFFSTEKTGTGLGLYLVKNLCESNQAKIEFIESDTGACFRITCTKV